MATCLVVDEFFEPNDPRFLATRTTWQRANADTRSIDSFPGLKAALLKGIVSNKVGNYEFMGFTLVYNFNELILMRRDEYIAIACRARLVPVMPTLNDAEIAACLIKIMNCERSDFVPLYQVRNQIDVVMQNKSIERIAAAWQVAMVPLCDDLKRVVVRFLVRL